MKQIVIQEDTNLWYTVKDMCDICNVDEKTFRNFKISLESDFQSEIKTLAHNKKLYSESVLKQFQAWLMRNQANQGKSSDVVKAAATTAVSNDIALREIINSGNVEAIRCLMEHYVAETAAIGEAKRLQQQNQQLQLEVDKYVQWMSASQIKKEYHLPAKPGITKVAQLLGLKRNEDWIEKNYGDDTCFTKILYSPSAVKLIVDWHFED